MSGQFMTSPNFKLILYYHSEGRTFDLKMLQAFSFININVKAKRILQGLWIYHVCVQGFLLLKERKKKKNVWRPLIYRICIESGFWCEWLVVNSMWPRVFTCRIFNLSSVCIFNLNTINMYKNLNTVDGKLRPVVIFHSLIFHLDSSVGK